jgi:hypothetical protein
MSDVIATFATEFNVTVNAGNNDCKVNDSLLSECLLVVCCYRGLSTVIRLAGSCSECEATNAGSATLPRYVHVIWEQSNVNEKWLQTKQHDR